MRLILVLVVLAVLLALATVVPAVLADRMQPTVYRTHVEPSGRRRIVELDLGSNPGQPLVVPDVPGAPPTGPVLEPGARLYLTLLAVLVLLLALPAGLRRLYRAAGGA